MQSSGGDPTISLGVQVPQASGTAINPLGMLNSWSEIQNRLNQNQLFQQQISAKNGIGEIMSGPGDMESKLNSVAQSPYAGYAGEYLNNMRSVQKTLLDMDLEKGKAGQGVLQDFFKSLGPAYKDPSMVPYIKQSLMGVTPKQISGDVSNAIDSYTLGLTHGLPSAEQMKSDPQAAAFATKTVQDRILNTIAPNVPDAVLRSMTGTVAPAVTEGIGPGGQAQPQVAGSDLYGNAPRVPIQTPQGSGLIGQPATGAPAAANALGAGPTLQQKSASEAGGKVAGDISKDMSEVANMAPVTLKRLDLISNALGQIQTGPWTSARQGVAQAMQGLKDAGVNIPDSSIQSVMKGSLTAAQVLDAQLKPVLIQELKRNQEGSRIFAPEIPAWLGLIDKNKTPDAMLDLVNQMKYEFATQYDRAQKFPAFAQAVAKGSPEVAGYGPEHYNQYYNDKFNPATMPSHMGAANSPATNLAPLTQGQVRGASGSPSLTSPSSAVPNTLTRPPITEFFK